MPKYQVEAELHLTLVPYLSVMGSEDEYELDEVEQELIEDNAENFESFEITYSEKDPDEPIYWLVNVVCKCVIEARNKNEVKLKFDELCDRIEDSVSNPRRWEVRRLKKGEMVA